MKSNVLPNDEDAGEWASEAALEEALRRLPAPAPPPGLEARLMAAIPERREVERSAIPPLAPPFKGGGFWIAWASLAAAILVLAAIVARSGARDIAGGPPTRGPEARQGTENSVFVVTKETDPCNILPPIPDWL